MLPSAVFPITLKCRRMSVKDLLRRNHVRVVEHAGGEPIVFAHGFGTDQTVWDGYIAELSKKYRCISFDHAGSGASDPRMFNPRRYSSLYAYANDLIEISEAFGGGVPVRAVGHSVSGMVSMIASLLRPELFSKLMVIGASPRYLNDPETEYIGGFNASDLDALFAAMSSNYHAWASGFAPTVTANPDRPDISAYLCSAILSIRPDIAQAVLKVIMLSDHRAELPRVQAPVWALAGSCDPVVPDCVNGYLAEHVPNLQLFRLTVKGHLPHVSEPAVVGALMKEWLED